MKIPVFCSLIPTELLSHLGHELRFLEADGLALTSGPACNCQFHENLCSYVKGLHDHLAKEHASYGMIIVPASCDAMKKLFDALKEVVPADKLHFLDVPQNKGVAASKFFAAELTRLARRLGPGS